MAANASVSLPPRRDDHLPAPTAPLAQWIERLASDQKVKGSSPLGGTTQEKSMPRGGAAPMKTAKEPGEKHRRKPYFNSGKRKFFHPIRKPRKSPKIWAFSVAMF